MLFRPEGPGAAHLLLRAVLVGVADAQAQRVPVAEASTAFGGRRRPRDAWALAAAPLRGHGGHAPRALPAAHDALPLRLLPRVHAVSGALPRSGAPGAKAERAVGRGPWGAGLLGQVELSELGKQPAPSEEEAASLRAQALVERKRCEQLRSEIQVPMAHESARRRCWKLRKPLGP